MIKLENMHIWKDDFLYKEQWEIKTTIYDDGVWWYCVDIEDKDNPKLFAYLHEVIKYIDKNMSE